MVYLGRFNDQAHIKDSTLDQDGQRGAIQLGGVVFAVRKIEVSTKADCP
jgi:hypothetical protein